MLKAPAVSVAALLALVACSPSSPGARARASVGSGAAAPEAGPDAPELDDVGDAAADAATVDVTANDDSTTEDTTSDDAAIEPDAGPDASDAAADDAGCDGAPPDGGTCECGSPACVNGVWACSCPGPAQDGGGTVELVSIDAAHPHPTFEGWGMSLAWEANTIYGGSRNSAALTTAAAQQAYLELLYSPTTGLGLTVARYNIGGGENPQHTHMTPQAQMEGYLEAPPSGTSAATWAANAANYDWTKDSSQRTMLSNAMGIITQSGGTPIVEAFSNSPPYWMTNSDCASGAVDGGDNLSPTNFTAFASYLTTVVEHFHSAWATDFRTLEPFNEPDGSWWKGGPTTGSQEGCAFTVASGKSNQLGVITDVVAALAPLQLTTQLAVNDSNNYGSIGNAFYTYKNDAGVTDLTGIAQVNTHGYSYESTNRAAVRTLATSNNLRISMSEVGTGSGNPITQALTIADSLRRDMAELQPTTWVFWQPDWDVLSIDNGNVTKLAQYYMFLQYMRFIRPGFAFLDVTTNGAEETHTVAAIDPATNKLVIVVDNAAGSPVSMAVDLSSFSGLPATASVYRTSSWQANGTSTADGSLTESFASLLPVAVTASKTLPVTAPPYSVTTFVF